MKLNRTKIAVFLVAFTLLVGVYSQSTIPQAAADIQLPECVGIINNCNDLNCSSESSPSSTSIAENFQSASVFQSNQGTDDDSNVIDGTFENSTIEIPGGQITQTNEATISQEASASAENSATNTGSAETSCSTEMSLLD